LHSPIFFYCEETKYCWSLMIYAGMTTNVFSFLFLDYINIIFWWHLTWESLKLFHHGSVWFLWFGQRKTTLLSCSLTTRFFSHSLSSMSLSPNRPTPPPPLTLLQPFYHWTSWFWEDEIWVFLLSLFSSKFSFWFKFHCF